MKNLLLTALCALMVQSSFAQITLEHKLPLNSFVTKINATDYRFVTVDTGKNLVSIYNPDYTLDKSITLQRPAGSSFSGARTVSKNLFNTNNQYNVALGLTIRSAPAGRDLQSRPFEY